MGGWVDVPGSRPLSGARNLSQSHLMMPHMLVTWKGSGGWVGRWVGREMEEEDKQDKTQDSSSE